MYHFHAYFTNDGSVGLYNDDFNDIYHSATGALTEAYEKFITPINFETLLRKDKIKILDICFGVGYNSKSFLNYILKNVKKNSWFQKAYATIHTNNIIKSSNAEIYTDNIFDKIYIKAVDNDKILSYLSPFIKTGAYFYNNNNLDFRYERIRKLLNQRKLLLRPKIDNLINLLFFEKLVLGYPEFSSSNDLYMLLNSTEYSKYFDPFMRHLYLLYKDSIASYTHNSTKRLSLHNIYYKYIPKRYKKHSKMLDLRNVEFELKNEDARKTILEDNNTYNLIFLDAFSPSKCPCLWSYEFFKELYKHLEPDGMLLTYSMSASIRSAMIEAGFFIGDNINKRLHKPVGTIAAKTKSLIKNPLSEFDSGLLKTKAGIFYRDENLNLDNGKILDLRDCEVENSKLETTSKYINYYKRTHDENNLFIE